MEQPTKENTLYLVIKQTYFDQILAGTKKEEYREIKDTTWNKYLTGEYDDDYITEDDESFGDICIYCDGHFPYYPIEYKYLNLAVGYAKVRDTATVEITDISFQVMKDKKGNEIIFDVDENDQPIINPKGKFAFWEIVYHLGNVVSVNKATNKKE